MPESDGLLLETIRAHVQVCRVNSHVYRALCPFHEEQTPSLHVYRSKKRWLCFGCGRGGDAVDFIREIEALDLKNA